MIDFRELAPFGVEVSLDLRQRSPDDVEQLVDLYARHHLLVFRNQAISLDDQLELVGRFGPDRLGADERTNLVTNEKTPDNYLGDGELAFHSDLSFCPKPYEAMSLFALEVEGGRSSTRFVDTSRAYAAMPGELKARLDGRRTLQVFGFNLEGRNGEQLAETMPSHVHPLIATHAASGDRFVMANRNHTARIVDLAPDESEALIADLFEEIYAPRGIYDHVWQPGDLLIWDNGPIQHARGPISDVGMRRLRRAITGEAGMMDQFPEFVLATSAVN